MRTRRTPRAGAVLTEILVAVLILCIGLIAVGKWLMNSAREQARAANTRTAVALAEQKIEALLSTPPTSLRELPTAGQTEKLKGGFVCESQISPAHADALRQVNVKVSWRDHVGTEHSVSMASILSVRPTE